MAENSTVTIGMDLGDKRSHLYVLENLTGDGLEQTSIATTEKSIFRCFSKFEPATVVLEVGTHSGWISRLLDRLGHQVLVADPRKVRRLAGNDDKDDKMDAEFLARIGRIDAKMLKPIRLRGEQTQVDLALIRSRDSLVKARTQLINHVRGMVKMVGKRLPSCSGQRFGKLQEQIPEQLREVLRPALQSVQALTEQIGCCDRMIAHKAEHDYPETELLRQVAGVGLITALAFVLTIEDPSRFSKSRKVGAYLGMTRRKYTSGNSDPELRISKQGDRLLRRLLVNCAQYILGPFGPDPDLRRWGLKYAAGGGKNAKKRAVVAVARKLAVLLHRLWTTGEEYEPLRNSGPTAPGTAEAA